MSFPTRAGELIRGFGFDINQYICKKTDPNYKKIKENYQLISLAGRITSALFLTAYLALGISSITSGSCFFLFISILGGYLNYNSFILFENIRVIGESHERLSGEYKLSKKLFRQEWVRKNLLKNTIQFDVVYDLGEWIENSITK